MDPQFAQQYTFVGVLALAALFMGGFPLIVARFVAPKKPSPSKNAAYECGLESKGDPWVQFRVQYYVYALLFVIFDVEVIFIYPWAISWKPLGLFALGEMALFLAILGVGLVYAWKKGVLEWE